MIYKWYLKDGIIEWFKIKLSESSHFYEQVVDNIFIEGKFWDSESIVQPPWLGMEFPFPIIIKKYSIEDGAEIDAHLRSWRVYDSNDNLIDQHVNETRFDSYGKVLEFELNKLCKTKSLRFVFDKISHFDHIVAYIASIDLFSNYAMENGRFNIKIEDFKSINFVILVSKYNVIKSRL